MPKTISTPPIFGFRDYIDMTREIVINFVYHSRFAAGMADIITSYCDHNVDRNVDHNDDYNHHCGDDVDNNLWDTL